MIQNIVEAIWNIKNKCNIFAKNKNGVSLITLVITIIIITIITGSIIFNLSNVNKTEEVDKLYTSLLLLKEKVNLYYLKHDKLPVAEEYTASLNFLGDTINPEDEGKYYILDIEALDNLSNILNKTYIINETTHTIYALEGAKLGDETFYRLPE